MSGRGGAGNILAVQQQSERVADDTEANLKPDTESRNPPEPNREEQQYAYTGRGGAGNYYVPKELEQTGTFNSAHRSHILGDGTLAPDNVSGKNASPQPTRWQGRGGAGNYSYEVAENEERASRKRLEEERLKEEKLKADIEQGVRESIAPPPKAKLVGNETF